LPSQEFLLSAFFWRTWIRLGPPPSRHLVNLLHFHQLGVTDGPQSGLSPYGIAPYNPPKHALECCRDALSLWQVGPSLPCLLLCSCQNVPECYCMTTWAAAVITGALSLGAPHAMAPPYIPIGQCKGHVISLRDYLTLFPGFVSRRVAISRPRRQSGSPSGPSLVQILLSLAPFVPPICALECCEVTARLGLGRTTPACPFWPYSPLCAFWAMRKNTKPTDP